MGFLRSYICDSCEDETKVFHKNGSEKLESNVCAKCGKPSVRESLGFPHWGVSRDEMFNKKGSNGLPIIASGLHHK